MKGLESSVLGERVLKGVLNGESEANYLLIERELGCGTFSSIVSCIEDSCTDRYTVLLVEPPFLVNARAKEISRVVPKARVQSFNGKSGLANIQAMLSTEADRPTYAIVNSYLWKLLNTSVNIDATFDVRMEEVLSADYYMLAADRDLAKDILALYHRRKHARRLPTYASA